MVLAVVEIPFNEEFADLMRSGQKRATSRYRLLGKPGDTFSAFGEEFVITDVARLPLRHVAAEFYKIEGFKSRAEFIRYWNRFHPRRPYRAEDTVFIHFFKRITPLTKH